MGCPANLSGDHVYGLMLRGVGPSCRCGAVQKTAEAEEARREAIRGQQCRDMHCPCRGDRAHHDELVAKNALRLAEQSEQSARYAVSEAQEQVFEALEALAAAEGRLRDRTADVLTRKAAVKSEAR